MIAKAIGINSIEFGIKHSLSNNKNAEFQKKSAFFKIILIFYD